MGFHGIHYYTPDIRGPILGTDILVSELDGNTLDERHNRFVTSFVGDVESEVGPWRCRYA